MATTFPVDTYPVLRAGALKQRSAVLRDVDQDGTPHIREVASSQWALVPLRFAPLKDSEANSLLEYLYDNAATEFDLSLGGETHTGYFWVDEHEKESDNGLNWISTSFYGKRSA